MDAIEGFENLKKFIQDYIKQDGSKLNMEEYIQETLRITKKLNTILVVDRIENSVAVCEDRETRKMIDVQLEDLPENIKEGDVIRYRSGKYEIDIEKQTKIEDRIRNKMDKLWE